MKSALKVESRQIELQGETKVRTAPRPKLFNQGNLISRRTAKKLTAKVYRATKCHELH